MGIIMDGRQNASLWAKHVDIGGEESATGISLMIGTVYVCSEREVVRILWWMMGSGGGAQLVAVWVPFL